MFQRFWQRLKIHGPWQSAMIVAVVSDALSFGLNFTGPLQWGVDLLTAIILFALLGLRWALFIPIFIEAVPFLAVFPTWVLAIGAMMALDKDTKAP